MPPARAPADAETAPTRAAARSTAASSLAALAVRIFAAPPLHYAYSAGTICLAGVIAHLISYIVPEPQVSLLFLAAVLACAILWGPGPSLFAAALAIAVKRYFFYAPLFDFGVDDPRHLLDLGVFSVIAILGGALAEQIRRQASASVQREANIAILHTFSGRLAGIGQMHEVYLAIVDHIGRAFGHEVVLMVPSSGSLAIVADQLHDDMLSDEEIQRAERLSRGDSGARGTGAALRWNLIPLTTARGTVAVLAVDLKTRLGTPFVDEKIHSALLDQAAVAIERALLATSLEDARVRAKADELRDAVVSAISHDLQTPLASILGSATALNRFGSLYDERARGELVATIQEEAERLNHFIRNVLDLTRIRADAVRPRLEAVELSDIVNSALRRAERATAGHTLQVDLPATLPMLNLDLFLMERALVNLIENAAKYSAPNGPIRIAASRHGDSVHLDVSDDGIGIDPQDRQRIFNHFFRSSSPDTKPAGTGLGLAICKSFIEANGGQVEAFSRGRGAGATFRVALPVPKFPAEPLEA